jgi:hypothetical protein
MSYIIKSTSPFVSIKLTQKGREQLAQGKLNFNFWAIGDSEINYNREAIVDANSTDYTLSAVTAIMRPFDRQPNIKSFITPSNTASPFNTIDNSVLNVVKAIVNNAAEERGFFTNNAGVFTTITGDTYSTHNAIISNSILTGTSTLSSIDTTNISEGDLILLKLANDTIGNIVPNENDRAMPNLWYKVKTKSVGSLTLDRNLPNMSGQTANSQIIVYKSGEVYETIATGTTTAYWDSGTLSFDSNNNITCHDVPVWNMNNVWCENLAGVTGLSTTNLYEDYTKFGSYRFLGAKNPFMEYLCDSFEVTSATTCSSEPGSSYLDTVSKSISIIHFTNNSISNLYGEFFFTDVANNKHLKLHLPDLMYNRRFGSTGSGTTMGMTFVATGVTQVIAGTDIEYIELTEDVAMVAPLSPKVVGRIYPQMKTVVIHDDEIVAASSYKSNRNWTLPELFATLTAPSGGTSTGVLNVNETMYLTYVLENEEGLSSSLPCQKYIKITNISSSAKDVSFRLSELDMLPYMRKLETGYDGYGFYANKLKLLYQIVVDANHRPNAGAWKEYDFTTTAITGGVGETIDPKLLENQNPVVNGFILDKLKDNNATIYSLISSLNLAPNVSPTDLQFGDEKIFYGNLSTYIGATIYKTIFDIRVNASQFNSTTNPTRSKDLSTNPPTLKISEVGIYDSERNLVCIGKLSSPIPLGGGSTIMLELSMDF